MTISKPKHKSLGYQIIFFIFVFIFLIFLISITLTRYLMSAVMIKNAEESVGFLVDQNIYHLESRIKRVQTHAADLVSLICTNNVDINTIESFVGKTLQISPEIESIVIASEDVNPSKLPGAKVYYRQTEKNHALDLPDMRYRYQDWYHIPILTDKDYWSEPWVDQYIDKINITSYSIPFKTQNSGRGVVRFDLSITYLQRIVLPQNFRKDAYAFLISHKGTMVTHPNEDFVMNESIFSLAETHNDPQLRELGKNMINGSRGFQKMSGSKFMKHKWIYHAPLISNRWSLGIVLFQRDVMRDLNRLLLIQGLIAMMGFLILAIIVYARTLHIYKPLRELTAAAKSIGDGDFNVTVPNSDNINEISMLEDTLRSLQQSVINHITNLRTTTDEKNKIETEVRFASEIQKNLIPSNKNNLNIKEISVYGIIEAAMDIGGDLYDYFMIDDERLCFVIADVSGKGIAAAMTMIMVSTLIRSKSKVFREVKEVLREINEFLCQNGIEANFVTMIIGQINLRTGELEYSNAGHVPLYIRKVNHKIVRYQETHSTALGVFSNLSIKSDVIQLDLGDEIILFTDGVTEAMSVNEMFFGLQRLENILADVNVQSPEHTAKAILKGVKTFCDADQMGDDLSILVIEFLHPKRKQ